MEILLSGTFPNDKFPSRAHDDDAGIDLLALESVTVRPGESVIVQTSAVGLAEFAARIQDEIAMVMPVGITFAGFVWDKSGLATRGITVLGGVIDNSYTDQIGVVLYNTNTRTAMLEAMSSLFAWMDTSEGSDEGLASLTASWDQGSVSFGPGDKVAQLIIQNVWVPTPKAGTLEMIRAAIRSNARGDKGFGSSGQ